MNDNQQRRVTALEQLFTEISCTRMQDVPVQNPAVRVQALGFAADTNNAEMLLGVLVTPWFMNLVRLPSRLSCADDQLLASGKKAKRAVGNESFEFIGASEPGVGAFEVCSLFSPMFEFANHAAALATASEVLSLLRAPEAPAASAPHTPPNRRGFLFGRGVASAGEPP
ncbi:MAG: [NiFe]-hydrogenase assembly chaperone HybE [Rhodoferax sp.]|uniref:[NiFe]-hydrogenase assembly chaperone HybE n=1 Tax=Rhodoferax sp. TaxID=50421 RepID=UPI00262F9E0C|nr:[NiFe]-hydrogenase assembly chaperone HybE [Rhodoferax sp.]MDD2882299.1 [NiFe]-hydrogenase assembly chaperone HybE [Rhodoferax sp.]